LKNVGRVIAFFGALIALVVAVGTVGWFLSRSAPGARSAPGGGGVSLSLCGLSSPDDLLIRFYLDARAAELDQMAGSDDTPVAFAVEPGETAVEIAARLKQAGLISDPELFRRYVQYHGLDAGIEAGEFVLRQTMTIPEIAQALQQGQRPEQAVTIQEGLRLEQVAAVVAEQTGIPEDEFLALATGGWRGAGLPFDFLADLPPSATLEGFLFPDTYRLPEDAAALDLLSRMLGTFDERVTAEMQAAAANRGLSVYELVTLASIVEREAVIDDERPLIAGVYHNRLESGWFLGACPSVQYALGTLDDWWPQFTLEATEIDSPYNTYRNLGLPPGPICSAGLASLEAAAYPADTDYFFFLADCTKDDGSHLFAVTEEEHLGNYSVCGGQVP
jgi:UPF0755 protein